MIHAARGSARDGDELVRKAFEREIIEGGADGSEILARVHLTNRQNVGAARISARARNQLGPTLKARPKDGMIHSVGHDMNFLSRHSIVIDHLAAS